MTNDDPAIRRLARTIDRVRRETRDQARASQAAFRSVELSDGPVSYYDEDGNERLVIGDSGDGTFTVQEVNSPPPPTPTQPDVQATPGGVRIYWDGTFIDKNRPKDLLRVEIHVGLAGADDTFPVSDATQMGEFASVYGGAYFYQVDASFGDVYVKLVAVNNALIESDASVAGFAAPDLIVSEPDGLVPVTPPGWALTLNQFAIGALEASWPTIVNTDPVEYDVWVAVGAPVAIFDATTYMGRTPATTFQIRSLPDGTKLLKDTNYYVAVRPRDPDGPSVTTTAAGPTQVRVADVDTIAANYVYAGRIEVDQLDSGDLSAEVALLGVIKVGPNITIKPAVTSPYDPGGLNIVLPTVGGLISLPADGTAALFRKVALEASSLLVYDNFELRGLINKISGTLKLAKGVEAFGIGPTVVSGWDDPTIQVLQTSGAVPRQIVDGGTEWITFNGSTVYGIHKTTGVVTNRLTGVSVDSITKAGTDYYLLSDTNNLVSKYNSSWVAQPAGNFATPADPANCSGVRSFCWDAATSRFYFAWFRNATDQKALVYSTTISGGSPTLVMTTADAQIAGSFDIFVGSADFATSGGSTQRFIFPGEGAGLNKVYNVAGTRVTAEDFPNPNGEALRGLWYDGTNFRAITGSKRVWKLSRVVTALARSVRASKWDSAGTTHETAWSPAVAFTHNPREWMKVQTADPGGTGGADEPNRVRHYIQTASLSASYFLQPDVTAAPWTVYYDIPATGTATAVSVTDFSSISSPGVVESSDTAKNIQLKGSGAGRVGPFETDENGVVQQIGKDYSAAATADITTTSTANSAITGLTFNIDVTSTADVWEVILAPDVSVSGTTPVNFVELLVDGVADAVYMVTAAATGAVAMRVQPMKVYRLTGLSAGSHTLSVRTRMQAASSTGVVRQIYSKMHAKRIA